MSSTTLFYYSKFDVFDLLIKIENQFLIGIEFINKGTRLYKEHINANDKKLVLEIQKQIDNYIVDSKYQFNLPLKIDTASEHVQKVCREILNIPAGTVKTYQMLADNINSGPRAVGNGCGRNPIALVIPCHRVVSKSGKLGGFMQSRLDGNLLIKLKLLEHEGVDIKHMLKKNKYE